MSGYDRDLRGDGHSRAVIAVAVARETEGHRTPHTRGLASMYAVL